MIQSQSTRQNKRKVHFVIEEENDIKPTKKQKSIQTKPTTIDSELNSLEFLSNYRLVNLQNNKMINLINCLIKMYENYLTQNSIIKEPVVNLISYLDSIYKIKRENIFHYKHIRNFMFTTLRIGCTNIDFIIEMLKLKINQNTNYNVFEKVDNISIISVDMNNRLVHQANFIQKDLECVNNIKKELEKDNLGYTIENVNKIINQEISKNKLIQYIVLDLILKSNIQFPNIINKANHLYYTTMKKMELENKYADLVIEFRM